jgi:hypothetical protein
VLPAVKEELTNREVERWAAVLSDEPVETREPVAVSDAPTEPCPYCSAPVAVDATSCPQCARPLTPAEPPEGSQEEPVNAPPAAPAPGPEPEPGPGPTEGGAG